MAKYEGPSLFPPDEYAGTMPSRKNLEKHLPQGPKSEEDEALTAQQEAKSRFIERMSLDSYEMDQNPEMLVSEAMAQLLKVHQKLIAKSGDIMQLPTEFLEAQAVLKLYPKESQEFIENNKEIAAEVEEVYRLSTAELRELFGRALS